MCLIAIAWKAHPEYSLIVGANRDEWHDRPASAATWWHDHPEILAGRDLKAGGTWLGVTRSGRFAALTNFRDPSDRKTDAPSRGQLVRNFLIGSVGPLEYLRELRGRADQFQGFNLLAGDAQSLYYFGSRVGEILAVPPGVHALSNHTLNEPWPKVDTAKSAMDEALRAKMPWKARQMAIYDLLSNENFAADDMLPDTGVGLEWERVLSPVLIKTARYGTRCSTVIGVTNSGGVSFLELTRDCDGRVTHREQIEFSLA